MSLAGAAAEPNSGSDDVNWRDGTFRAGGDADLPPLMLSAKGQVLGRSDHYSIARGSAAGGGLDVAVERQSGGRACRRFSI